MMAGVLAVLAGAAWYSRRRKLKALVDAVGGPLSVELVAEGFRTTTRGAVSTTPWSNVDHVHRIATHVFLFVPTEDGLGGVGGLIVPRRAFSDEPAFDAFTDLARRSVSTRAPDSPSAAPEQRMRVRVMPRRSDLDALRASFRERNARARWTHRFRVLVFAIVAGWAVLWKLREVHGVFEPNDLILGIPASLAGAALYSGSSPEEDTLAGLRTSS